MFVCNTLSTCFVLLLAGINMEVTHSKIKMLHILNATIVIYFSSS